MLVLIGLVLAMTKGKPHLAALLSIHPSFIFATGRLYPESTVALAVAGIILASLHLFKRRGWELTKWILLAIASIHLLLLVKGLSAMIGWALVALLFAWIAFDRLVPKFQSYSRNSMRGLSISIPIVLVTMIGASFAMGGSLATIRTHSVQWLFALLIALFDGFGLYLLVGLCCWPFVTDVLAQSKESRDNSSVFLLIFVASGTLLMSMWIASLWVYEANRWNLPLWKNMILMGNNGRYLTALVFPILLLLDRSLKRRSISIGKPLMLTLVLVLPLSMLAGMHGQTMWTDDAAQSFSDEIDAGEDFLYIDDKALAMHWLYTFRLEVDPHGEQDITGHWRAPGSNWQIELEGQAMNNRGDLSKVQYIVIAPDMDVILPLGWEKMAFGEAPYLNGGGQWTVYRAA